MSVEPVDGAPGVHVVDTGLFETRGMMSAYVVDAGRPAVVDPGAAATVDAVLDALDVLGIERDAVEVIAPTHVHLDHAGAAGALAAACQNATVVCHERGVPYLTDDAKLRNLVESARRAIGPVADEYGDPEPVPPARCRAVAGGDAVDLGDRTLEVVHAPGHAPHHAVFHDSETGGLFAGDAAGMYLNGALHPTTPPPDFDLEAASDTVERLRRREPEAIFFGHFGARWDAVDLLDSYADLLPRWVDAVADAADRHDDVDAMVNELVKEWPSPTITGDVPGVLRYLEEREAGA